MVHQGLETNHLVSLRPNEYEVGYAEAQLRNYEAKVNEFFACRAEDSLTQIRVRDDLVFVLDLELGSDLQLHSVHVKEADNSHPDESSDDADQFERHGSRKDSNSHEHF